MWTDSGLHDSSSHRDSICALTEAVGLRDASTDPPAGAYHFHDWSIPSLARAAFDAAKR